MASDGALSSSDPNLKRNLLEVREITKCHVKNSIYVCTKNEKVLMYEINKKTAELAQGVRTEEASEKELGTRICRRMLKHYSRRSPFLI